jgi:hypothetical protein
MHKKQKQFDRYKHNNALPSVAMLLSASMYKSKLLYLPVLFIISIFVFSVDDQEAIMLYLNKIQELSDHKISQDQKLWIRDFYVNNKNRDPLKEERHKIRDDFNRQRKHLIQQWEAHYKIKWPKEVKAQVLLDKPKHNARAAMNLQFKQRQKQLQKTGKKDKNKARDNGSTTGHAIDRYANNYQAHHTIPINAGGVNIFWNITPLNSKNHKLLHNSFEEKACFSHEFFHKKFMRFILKVQTIFMNYFKSYIYKREASYAK